MAAAAAAAEVPVSAPVSLPPSRPNPFGWLSGGAGSGRAGAGAWGQGSVRDNFVLVNRGVPPASWLVG